jgi:pimeloyl-ACP methyl ester carboxylesterase
MPARWRDRHRERRRRHVAADLAAALRALGQGAMEPLWDRLPECPMLLLTGSEDAKYRALAERIAASAGDAVHAVIEGAGHAPHLERPVETAAAIDAFLVARAL